jgi:hypothetical protein
MRGRLTSVKVGGCGLGRAPQNEPQNPIFFIVFDDGVAGGAAKRVEIVDGAWVRGQDFQGPTGWHIGHGLFGFEDR